MKDDVMSSFFCILEGNFLLFDRSVSFLEVREVSNLLHTKSDYFYDKNLLSQLSNDKKDASEEQIKQEIEKLKAKENAFYAEVLGYQVKDFDAFLGEMADKIKDVQSAFKKLSSFDKAEGLYQSFLKNINISSGMATTDKGKEDLSLLEKYGYINKAITAKELASNVEIDVSASLISLQKVSITFNKRKKVGKGTTKRTINLKEIISKLTKDAETITLQFFEEEVVPALEKELSADKTLKDFNISVPQLIGALKKSIVPLIKTEIAADPAIKESVSEAIYSQGALYSSQRAALYKRKSLPDEKENKRINQIILNYLLKEVQNKNDFTAAFNRAWSIKDADGNDFIDALTMNGSSNFTGAIGELGGLTLLFYVNPNIPAAQWTGSEINRYGEQKRQDIMLGAFGIQVKNYKETTLNFPTAIKLHPSELFQQLAMRGFNQSEVLKDIFANMVFNKTIGENENYSNGVKEILSHYLGALLNFNIGDANIDSNNIWLVGGNMLVPGSEILAAYLQTISDSKIADIKITTSYKGKTDEEYKSIKKDGTSPEFTDYWKKRKNNIWYPTAKMETTYNNLIYTDAISVKTSFVFSKIFNNMEKYRFLS